jgi:hypothetical protein
LATKQNLRAFETYAPARDPKCEKVKGLRGLDADLERLEDWDEPILRESEERQAHS